MTTEIYHIEGMSCAACSSAVERVTRKLDGVEQSDVNLTTNRMTITYDEAKVKDVYKRQGLVFVVPTSTNFNATVSGYGFLALAVLIFGQWKPVKILYASLFFGLMKAVASAYSGIPFLAGLGIPSYFYKMVPYIATLVVLIFTSKNSQAPRASGVPYDKGQR